MKHSLMLSLAVAIVLCSIPLSQAAAQWPNHPQIAFGLALSETALGRGEAAWAVPYWTVDAAFAAMLMQLAAIEEGLGVLFFGLFDHSAAVMDTFAVPADRQPVGALAIGVPDGEDDPGRSATRPRRPLDAIVHRGHW